MPPKTVEEQLAELELEAEAPTPPPKTKTSRAPRQKRTDDADALKELEELEALEKFQAREAPRPASRSNTPKLSSSSNTSSSRRPADVATPSSTGSARTSEDNRQSSSRKSGESTQSFYHSSTGPAVASAPPSGDEAKQATGGSWWGGGWGGLLSTATAAADAAKKQAEAAYQELQKNEEAKRWAEQVRGNVGTLRDYGDELSKRALPTFENILHTLAPPISQHERLQIHVTHDLVGYPSLDPLLYKAFAGVMDQVEGGDLLVIQRGSRDGFRGGGGGWNDGPWWRHTDKRDLSVVAGLAAGTKLARISAETYASDFFATRGGLEEAVKQATEVLSETNPVRTSDIFIAIQAVSCPPQDDLFASPSSAETQERPQDQDEEEVVFALYLHDPVHNISLRALSQALPLRWVAWLDASTRPETVDGEAQLPQEIHEMIESGGVDPREWISEWMEETITLSIGIIAQRYVARRMGVGESGLGKGRAREAALEAGGGEAARAGII